MTERYSWKTLLAVGGWLLIVVSGVLSLTKYSSTPGAQSPAPRIWPSGTSIQRRPGVSTLVMMSHPKCPCTRASIAELHELMSRFRDRLDAYVLFVEPDGVETEWSKTDLWNSATTIPGVQVVLDPRGADSSRFAGLTSGQVVLYDAEGRLKFSGGITSARGHIGDNLGLQRIAALLTGNAIDRDDSPVFGCALHSPE